MDPEDGPLRVPFLLQAARGVAGQPSCTGQARSLASAGFPVRALGSLPAGFLCFQVFLTGTRASPCLPTSRSQCGHSVPRKPSCARAHTHLGRCPIKGPTALCRHLWSCSSSCPVNVDLSPSLLYMGVPVTGMTSGSILALSPLPGLSFTGALLHLLRCQAVSAQEIWLSDPPH